MLHPGSAMPQQKQWIVTTSAERPMRDVVKDLESAGFSVRQVFDEIQSVAGSAGEEAVSRLRQVQGVTDVSPDEPIEIGPPESGDTW